MIDDLPAGDSLVADKGYDSERIREQAEAKGMEAVIPRRRNSKKGNASIVQPATNCPGQTAQVSLILDQLLLASIL